MKMHEKHGKGSRGLVGGAILVVAGIFFTMHILLPEAKVWPAALFVVGIAVMAVSHYKKVREE